jgi:hypothetical protein
MTETQATADVFRKVGGMMNTRYVYECGSEKIEKERESE